MTTKRKPMRAKAAPRAAKKQPLPEPTDNQMLEAMATFERSKVRYVLTRSGDSFAVNVTPEQSPSATATHHSDADLWFEIAESIKFLEARGFKVTKA